LIDSKDLYPGPFQKQAWIYIQEQAEPVAVVSVSGRIATDEFSPIALTNDHKARSVLEGDVAPLFSMPLVNGTIGYCAGQRNNNVG